MNDVCRTALIVICLIAIWGITAKWLIIRRSGIYINDGGRGFIFVFRWSIPFVYICFWTKWIAPRCYVIRRDEGWEWGASCDP